MNEPKAVPFQVVTVVHEVQVQASRAKVWAAVTDEIDAWWPADFHTIPEPRKFVVETRVGGRVYEDGGDGPSLLWGTVIGLRPGTQLQTSGELTAPFGGPAHTQTSWDLEEADGGGITLRLTQNAFGALSEECASNMKQGWAYLLDQCMKPSLES